MHDEYAQQIERDYGWNYAMIAGVEGVWGFAAALVSIETILPAFLDRLGASAMLIGLVPAVFRAFLTAPQLLTAKLTRNLPLKKFVFTAVHYPGCLALFPLAWVAWTYADSRRGVVIAAAFVWVALFGLSISFAMPMWINVMAKLFPAQRRGRAFGLVFLLGSLSGTVGSMWAARVLARHAFPSNFALLFVAAGVLLAGGITSFIWLREPRLPSVAQDHTASFIRDVFAAMRHAPGFGWFLAARCIGTLSLMAAAYYTVAGLNRFSLDTAAAGRFGAVMLIGKSIGSLVAGRLGDRFGFKLISVLVPAADMAAALLALVAPSPVLYHGVFLLFGMRASMAVVGMHSLTIEYCPTADKTTFIALSSAAVCPAYVLGPALGGLLATYHPWGYQAVFGAAFLCAVPSLLMMVFCVHEPRKAEPNRG